MPIISGLHEAIIDIKLEQVGSTPSRQASIPAGARRTTSHTDYRTFTVTYEVTCDASAPPGPFSFRATVCPQFGVPDYSCIPADLPIAGVISSPLDASPFAFNLNPASAKVTAGDSIGNSSDLVVFPSNNWSGKITLDGIVPDQSGISISFNPTTVTLTKGKQEQVTTAIVTADNDVKPGTYIATITGTSSGQSITASMPVIVNAPGPLALTLGDVTWYANVAFAGYLIYGRLTSSLLPIPQPTEHVSYSWSIGRIYRADRNNFSHDFRPYEGRVSSWWAADENSSSPMFSTIFYQPGQYILEETVTAVVHHVDGSVTSRSATRHIGIAFIN